MFKNRFFLYGLGIGLITAALLLELLSYAEQDRIHPTTEPIHWDVWFAEDIDQLQSIADEHGYRIVASEVQLYTEEQLEDELQQVREQLNQQEAMTADPEPSEEVPDSDVFKISITRGMTMSDVAEALVESGLLQTDTEFRDVMYERRLNTKIKSGIYEFPHSITVEDIVDQITIP